MKCPFCKEKETSVLDSRPTEDGGVIRRRRIVDVSAKKDSPPLKEFRLENFSL